MEAAYAEQPQRATFEKSPEKNIHPSDVLYKAYERGNLCLPQTSLGTEFAVLACLAENIPPSFQELERSTLSPEQIEKTGTILTTVHAKRNIPVRAATPEEEEQGATFGSDGKYLANSAMLQKIWKNVGVRPSLGLLTQFVEFMRVEQGKPRISDELEEERIQNGLSDGKILDLFYAMSPENTAIVQEFLSKIAVSQQLLEKLADQDGQPLCDQYRKLFSFVGMSDEERTTATDDRIELSKIVLSKICFHLKKEMINTFPDLESFLRSIVLSNEEYMYPAPDFKKLEY